MRKIDLAEAQAVQGRIMARIQKYPQANRNGKQWYAKVGSKYIYALSGATDTHILILVRSDQAPSTTNMTIEARAELRKQHPDDMWEFMSTDPKEVEKQYNDLLDKLETT